MNRTEYVKAVVGMVNLAREEKATENKKDNEDKKVKPVTIKEIKEILDIAQTVAYTEMANKGEVTIFEGLKLMGVHKDATTARNPIDGSTVQVPEKTVPKAKFGAVAKRIVNGEA